jgi:hypothetical protein
MRTTSTTPLKSRSDPMGRWIGIAVRPKNCCTLASERSKLDLSRSNRLMTIPRGRLNSSENAQTFSVWTSTPATPSTSTSAASAAASVDLVSLMNMLNPGVSIRLIFFLFHSATAIALEIVILRWISSSS